MSPAAYTIYLTMTRKGQKICFKHYFPFCIEVCLQWHDLFLVWVPFFTWSVLIWPKECLYNPLFYLSHTWWASCWHSRYIKISDVFHIPVGEICMLQVGRTVIFPHTFIYHYKDYHLIHTATSRGSLWTRLVSYVPEIFNLYNSGQTYCLALHPRCLSL
jgi:hypothetical protein